MRVPAINRNVLTEREFLAQVLARDIHGEVRQERYCQGSIYGKIYVYDLRGNVLGGLLFGVGYLHS